MEKFFAYFTGILFLGIIILLNWVVTRKSVFEYMVGADGRPSSSKLQFLIFTLLFIYGFITIHAYHLYCSGFFELISNIPPDILVTMGISTTTALGAKGITIGYTNSGRLNTSPKTSPKGTSDLKYLVCDDDGVPDLTKFQMLAWTLVAGVIYILMIAKYINEGRATELPDIDPSLIVLLGMGHGTYLGKKLVTSDTPRLSGVAKLETTAAGNNIAIYGASLDTNATGNQVTVNGVPLANQVVSKWNDNEIDVLIPLNDPSGVPYKAGDQLNISAIINGTACANSIPFTWS